MPRGSPLVTFFVVALALKKTALQIRFFSVLLMVFSGSSPITTTSPSSNAHQKSGSFPPPALPGFNSRMTLSDSRQSRRLSRR